MKMLIAVIALAFVVMVLAGCMSLGVQKMTPEQIKATEGMLTCDNIFSIYARGNSAAVHLDKLHKGTTSNSKITVNPDCGITIETGATGATTTVPGTRTTIEVPATTTTITAPAKP